MRIVFKPLQERDGFLSYFRMPELGMDNSIQSAAGCANIPKRRGSSVVLAERTSHSNETVRRLNSFGRTRSVIYESFHCGDSYRMRPQKRGSRRANPRYTFSSPRFLLSFSFTTTQQPGTLRSYLKAWLSLSFQPHNDVRNDLLVPCLATTLCHKSLPQGEHGESVRV